MTRATFAAAIEALRPRPGSSASPSRPDLAKRADHMETRFGRRVQPFGNGFDAEPSSRSRTIALARVQRSPDLANHR